MTRLSAARAVMLGLWLGLAAVCQVIIFTGQPIIPKLNVSPSPAALTVQQVYGGAVATPRQISISAPWTAQVDVPWLTLQPTGGTASDTLKVTLVDWRASSMLPGWYTGSITVKAGGDQVVVIPYNYQIVPARPAPFMTSPQPPVGCVQSPGYTDADTCSPEPDQFKPVIGMTFQDQTFGAQVRVLTDVNNYHAYSTPNPLSANNKYFMVFRSDGWFDVRDFETSALVAKNVPANQSVFWDASNDEVYYYTSGSTMRMHNVVANMDMVLVDYGAAMPNIERGGTGDSSKDNWISFFERSKHQVCALDLTRVLTYCADYAQAPGLSIPKVDFTLIAKGVDRATGKRYVIVNGAPSNIVYSVNEGTKKLDFEYRGPSIQGTSRYWFGSHTDTLEVAGVQYMVFNDWSEYPCEFALNMVQLNKGTGVYTQSELGGGRSKVFTLWRCPYATVDEHVACAKKTAACVISTQSVARASTDTSPIKHTPHDNEIIVFRPGAYGDEIRRVTKTHTVKYSDRGDLNYWGIPRASISNDGTQIVYDSTYGDPSGSRASVVKVQ